MKKKKTPQTWAPNARVLRSLFADLASNARSGFGAEVHFAIVDTGGGENNGGGAASKDGGRAAAALAEQCGVRALPAFQIWLGGDLQRSLGGVEAASVVVSEEEAAAAEAEREAERGRAEVLLRRAAGGVLSQIRRLTGASQKKSSSSSSSFSPVALRTRLAAELRTIAGPPIPSTLWISRVLIQPAGKVYNKRWEVLKVAAAVAAAGAVVGSAVSTRAARRWEREDYETLPTEAHRRRARAQAVERLAGTRARLGGLSFLTPVRGVFFLKLFFFKLFSFLSPFSQNSQPQQLFFFFSSSPTNISHLLGHLPLPLGLRPGRQTRPRRRRPLGPALPRPRVRRNRRPRKEAAPSARNHRL